jgi:hypothetical protein
MVFLGGFIGEITLKIVYCNQMVPTSARLDQPILISLNF